MAYSDRELLARLIQCLDAQYAYLCRIRNPSVPMERVHEYVKRHLLSLDDRGEGKKLKESVLMYMHDLEKVAGAEACDG